MNIEFPITIQPPPIVFPDGTIKEIESFELQNLEIDFIDRPRNKTVSVRVFPFPKEVTLWSGDDYDTIGDWTQEQADSALTMFLSANPVAVFESLF